MRPASYIAFGLILATAVNVTAIMRARAESYPTVWIVFATSAHDNTVQHITTAKYLERTTDQAMALCEKERSQIIAGMAKEGLKPIVEPVCSLEKPRTWVD